MSQVEHSDGASECVCTTFILNLMFRLFLCKPLTRLAACVPALQPMGIAFEEIKDGNGAVVVGFTENSSGAKLGVRVGETLVACRQVNIK